MRGQGPREEDELRGERSGSRDGGEEDGCEVVQGSGEERGARWSSKEISSIDLPLSQSTICSIFQWKSSLGYLSTLCPASLSLLNQELEPAFSPISPALLGNPALLATPAIVC